MILHPRLIFKAIKKTHAQYDSTNIYLLHVSAWTYYCGNAPSHCHIGKRCRWRYELADDNSELIYHNSVKAMESRWEKSRPMDERLPDNILVRFRSKQDVHVTYLFLSYISITESWEPWLSVGTLMFKLQDCVGSGKMKIASLVSKWSHKTRTYLINVQRMLAITCIF